MVEGDLLDLTLPTLLSALSKEGSTAVLRLQRGTDYGAVYFCEGALVHALAGEAVGDAAVCELLGWPDGRFRLARDAAEQPRTISPGMARVVTGSGPGQSSGDASSEIVGRDRGGDEQLLDELLTLLARLEQDKVRLEEGRVEVRGVAVLVLLATVVNSMVAAVTARCTDPAVLPSRVLPRLADEHPFTQMLGEERDRITIMTAAGVLKNWSAGADERDQLHLELCRALIGVLAFYGQTACTFFRGSREREEWRTTFGVFVEALGTALHEAHSSCTSS